jgi:putative transposase
VGFSGAITARFVCRELFADRSRAVSNVRRLLTSDKIFFVTVRLRKKLALLAQEEFPLVIGAIEGSRRKLGFLWCGYVLMPDHWHALVGVQHPVTISRALQDIKWIAARRVNRKRQTTGPLWQHQFWDRFVRNGKEFSERLEYMHLNPVRKGLVARAEDWKWSSYNNYALESWRVADCPMQVDYVRLPD